jgi:hypothetical protein
MYPAKNSPRKRVMSALNGEIPDRIPFTVYECMIPQCTVERQLRDRGLCIVYRMQSYNITHPNVNVKSYHYTDDRGRNMIKTIYSTPVGELSTLTEPASFTSWTYEYMFKTPDDYKALLFMINDSIVKPAYEDAALKSERLGEDFIVRDQLPSEPLQILISHYMGTEGFCMEWMDNRDEILKLYDALVCIARKTYPLVADGPLKFANLGGNVVPQVIGIETFKNYFVPHYNEAAEILHKKNKLIGCHFDADNTAIMDAIAATELDYIEAYDPGISPSISEARKVWPNKVLWLNWPSAWHLNTVKQVREDTIRLIKEASPGNGFIIGITEDVPEERWQQNYLAIMDGTESCKLR